MKKNLLLLPVLILLLLSGQIVHAQVTFTTTNTATICYNDGTLTVAPSGGTGPYTCTILSGPSSPNLTYPITMAAGSYTFSNLPHGSYTIQVTDAPGASVTGTGAVGGTYQFPVCTAAQSGNSIVCNVVSGTGNAPYLYAISHTGPNSGFSAYQSSNSFTGMCPGTYWVRVQDACGNIYTTSVTYIYALSYTLQCVNFSHGTLSLTGVGGHAPYTYSVAGQTNQTGTFTGLPAYFLGQVTITDSCGVQGVFLIAPGSGRFQVGCPFDSSIYLSGYTPTQGLSQNGTITYVCTSCTPVQSSSNTSGPLFQHVGLNQTYQIMVITPACGGDTMYTSYTPIQPPSSISVRFTSCNTFIAQLYVAGVAVYPPNIDSFVLQSFATNADIEVNQTGVFTHIPDGTYNLSAYSSISCAQPAHTVVSVPHMPPSCSYMMMNSSCQKSWEFSLDSISGDHYTLVYTPGDTVRGAPSHNGMQALVNFYSLQPGSHTLISDSGCTWPLYFDSIPRTGTTAYSSISCGGTPSIHIADTPYNNCNTVVGYVYYRDSLIGEGVTPINMNVLDSGWYTYRFYASSYAGDSSLVRYDTICPIDTGRVYVGYGSIPYPFPATLYECGTALPPLYSIYGGQVPYTVEIPGYDTVVLNSNTGVFPTAAPGVYNVIAYDNCGISRSFNFTILDTCAAVNCATIHAGNDTTICIGSSVLLTSTVSYSGGAYQWSPGAGASADTLVSPTATTTYVVSYTQNRCPQARDSTIVTVVNAPRVGVGDTVLCLGHAVTLVAVVSPPGGSYSWSPGAATSPSITVSPVTNSSYTVQYSLPGCPPAIDSSVVSIADTPTASVMTYPAVCYSPTGLAIAITSRGTQPYKYAWSDPMHSITDTLGGLYPGASYMVTVSDVNLCTATASGLIGDSLAPLTIVLDSLANIGCPGAQNGYISVSIPNSTNETYHWSPATGDSVLTNLSAGIYHLTATDPAGCMDTMSFAITEPPTVTLSITPDDSTLREGDSLSLYSLLTPYPAGSLSYDWTPTVGLSCYTCAQPVFDGTAGDYHYTLIVRYNGVCTISDTVSVKVYSTHQIYVPNAFTPNGDGVNDIFQSFPIGARQIDLKIYNRWGEKLFESLDAGKGWDGKYKGNLQPPGVYVYTLDVTFNDGYTVHDKGSVTLIR